MKISTGRTFEKQRKWPVKLR